jgi:hypothetical protein
MVQKLQQQGDHRWLLLDLPEGYSPLTRSLLTPAIARWWWCIRTATAIFACISRRCRQKRYSD